mgnify:CR=1 FL=1
MTEELEGAKLVEPRIEHFVHYRGRQPFDGNEAIDSCEGFLSRARERAINIPDASEAFFFFDIFTAKIILPNGRFILVEEKMSRSDVYYYEGEIVDSKHVKTRLGKIEPLVRDGDQII